MKAIVTGHSRGLGAAFAEILLERGAQVLGLSRRSNPDLAARYPGLLSERELDLSDPDAVSALLSGGGALGGFLSHGEGPFLLVNNAGMVEPIGPAGSLNPGTIARAVALNVTAPLLLADAFIAMTGHAADRRIMHVSSGAGRGAYAGWSVYCATKAALDQHAAAVAEDARPGLRIAAMAPGVVDTEMQATIRATTEEQFVLRDRFVGLKESGSLAGAQETAALMAGYLLCEAYGEQPRCDVRDLG